MSHFLLGCALGAAIAASVGVPLFAPWPFRVRYLATAQTIDPLLGFGPTPRLATRAVTVVSVEAVDGHVQLELADLGSGRDTRRTTLSRRACTPAVVAELDGWATLREPLLMIIDEDRSVHLYGPKGAVTDLLAVAKEGADDSPARSSK